MAIVILHLKIQGPAMGVPWNLLPENARYRYPGIPGNSISEAPNDRGYLSTDLITVPLQRLMKSKDLEIRKNFSYSKTILVHSIRAP